MCTCLPKKIPVESMQSNRTNKVFVPVLSTIMYQMTGPYLNLLIVSKSSLANSEK